MKMCFWLCSLVIEPKIHVITGSWGLLARLNVPIPPNSNCLIRHMRKRIIQYTNSYNTTSKLWLAKIPGLFLSMSDLHCGLCLCYYLYYCYQWSDAVGQTVHDTVPAYMYTSYLPSTLLVYIFFFGKLSISSPCREFLGFGIFTH